MDRGLSRAVERFVEVVTDALRTAAAGTTVDTNRLSNDATVEAFNLCAAFVDSDNRHSDDELWALVATFAPHGLLPGAATPDNLRDSSLITGKRTWLAAPSELFATLAGIDAARGTGLARAYYEQAMAVAHTVASLDRYPSDRELTAIVDYQRMLLAAITAADGAGSGRPATGAAGAAEPTVEGETEAEAQAVAAELGPPEPLEDLLAELDRLIGLGPVKEQVRLLSALLRVQQLRADRGLPVVEGSMHLIFSGNPGTGKTTVARLLARIYRSLGAVERGHLVEVDRSGLVAGFVGQTATRVTAVFDRADGGVLLVDEAYSLTRGGDRDFGREAIDAVVKQVEDRRDSMVVILTGYPAEMDELVAANPGLASRFPKTIHFPDYDDDELVQILELIAGQGAYRLTGEAKAAAKTWFGAHRRGRGFGNGRLARNLFEAAVARHATRLIDVTQPSDVDLTTLEAADIASVPTSDEQAGDE